MNLRKWTLATIASMALACLGVASTAQAALTYSDFLNDFQNNQYAGGGNNKQLKFFDDIGGGTGGSWNVQRATVAGGVYYYEDAEGSTRTFKTFCLEDGVTFSLGTAYYATMEDTALFGANESTPNGDLLNSATKLLYGLYFEGTLDNATAGLGANKFLYTDTADNTALQQAFWKIENSLYAANAQAVALMNWALGSSMINDYDDKVMALNLWSSYNSAKPDAPYSGDKQSQLVYVGDAGRFDIPEPVSMLTWSALTGLGLVFGRRRCRK